MNTAERYLHEVLGHVPAAFPERRARIADDLRSHLAESVAAGESEAGAVRRMGPPEQTAATFLDGVPLSPAPLADRAGAYLFDQALFAAPLIAAVALRVRGSSQHLAGPNDASSPGEVWFVAVIVIATILVPLLYFPLLEARTGQTLGKRLFRVAVVKTGGTAVRFGAALLRRLPTLFRFALIDSAFALFTARRQRAFDFVAGTMVVSAPGTPRRARAWAATGVVVALAAAAVFVVARATRATAPPDAAVELREARP